MSDIKFIIGVFAVGFPSLLLVVGLILYSGSSLLSSIVDTSDQMSFGANDNGYCNLSS